MPFCFGIFITLPKKPRVKPFCFGTFDKLMEEAEGYAILFYDIR